METPYGFKGLIIPTEAIKDLDENWIQEGIFFSLKEGIFEVGFNSEEKREKALDIANTCIMGWNFRYGKKIKVNFNQSWRPKDDGGQLHQLNLQDNITANDRLSIVSKVTLSCSYAIKARIVNSCSFVTNKSLVKKISRDEDLRRAIEFYSEEVVDEKRPLYGIYKALEVLTKKLGGSQKDGRNFLGQLAGHDKKYVDEVMETAQTERHAITSARKLLTEQECRSRTKKLIEAYEKFI